MIIGKCGLIRVKSEINWLMGNTLKSLNAWEYVWGKFLLNGYSWDLRFKKN